MADLLVGGPNTSRQVPQREATLFAKLLELIGQISRGESARRSRLVAIALNLANLKEAKIVFYLLFSIDYTEVLKIAHPPSCAF